MASTVRVDDKLPTWLRELARAEHRPIGRVIEDAVDQYEREKFWVEVNESVERLRTDPIARQDYQDEIALLEGGAMNWLEHKISAVARNKDAAQPAPRLH